MDLVAVFKSVVGIVNGTSHLKTGWESLLDCLQDQSGECLAGFERIDIAAEVTRLQSALRTLVQSEPVPGSVDTLYFGLFDAVDDQGAEATAYYVSGVAGFSRKDGDSLCRPVWWPENRFLASTALRELKQAEIHARNAGNKDGQRVLAYAGELGIAALLSRFSSRVLPSKLNRVVGFDSGDFVEIAW